MALTYDFLEQFDFIHASPPCQSYSYITPHPERHERLIEATKQMLYASGKPHVVENVQGAVKELRPNLSLDGHAVGLPIERRRYFFVSTWSGSRQVLGQGETIPIHRYHHQDRETLIRAFGLADYVSGQRLSRITIAGIEQGIPPAMTCWIAKQIFHEPLRIG